MNFFNVKHWKTYFTGDENAAQTERDRRRERPVTSVILFSIYLLGWWKLPHSPSDVLFFIHFFFNE